MAVVAKIDRVITLEATERHGSVVRLVRQARVVGLVDTDYTTLFSALAAAGIPASGSALSGAPNLVLAERNPRLLNKGVVDVDLVYEHFDNEGQSLSTPIAGSIIGEVRATVQQTTSNTDENEAAITVSHTYPATDPDFPGETKTIGGEINYFSVERTFSIKGIKTSSRPWLIANSIVGKLNRASWLGEAAREWMCISAAWRVHDRSGLGAYFMSFEFQHNPDSWDPTVVFIDERTNRPPVGLVEGVGYKTVRKHGEVNFEGVIGVRIQGA